jgi:putative FmdB family regulatory protein
MIYEYKCKSCEVVQEAFRKVATRLETPVCEVCTGETELIMSVAGGFKIKGEGAYNSNFQSRSGKSRQLFDNPVGPLDPRSRAFEKKQDDASSKYYGPGQSSSMNTTERREYNRKVDGMDHGGTKFD